MLSSKLTSDSLSNVWSEFVTFNNHCSWLFMWMVSLNEVQFKLTRFKLKDVKCLKKDLLSNF